MKTSLALMLFFSFCYLCAESQSGLEHVIVEEYYNVVSADTIDGEYNGHIQKNAKTYRIYLDLLPGWRFQAAYGSEDHPLMIRSTEVFFNNTSMGSTIPNVIPRRCLGNNTVMLDSWLSVGSAGEDMIGVPLVEDDVLGTVLHDKQFLKVLHQKDGLKQVEKLYRPTFFGIEKEVSVFDKKNSGSEFFTTNGAWACMGKGSVGFDSLGTNKILIAQLTTSGVLSFQLNVQLADPNGKSIRFVFSNPKEDEILQPELMFTSKKRTKNKRR